MGVGHISRAGVQAIYFVIIARGLGVNRYGAFAATVALASLIIPFANFGAGTLLIKNVAIRRSLFAEYWGNALIMTAICGGALVLFFTFMAQLLLSTAVSLSLVFWIAIAELFFARFTEVAGQAFQAVQRLKRTAQLYVLISLSRLLAAALVFLLLTAPSSGQWAFAYAAASAITSLIAIHMVNRELQRPLWILHAKPTELREGLSFAFGLTAQTVYVDIDKTMLARLHSLRSAGIYTAAYRVADLAFVPVRALTQASFARFFQEGSSAGLRGGYAFARRLLPLTATYGLLVGILLLMLAPALTGILGSEYSSSVDALRWLSPLPFLQSIHHFYAYALTGGGRQSSRAAIQIAVALLNVLLNFALIPRYSWRGAAWATLVSEAVLLILLWWVLRTSVSRETVREA